MYGLTSDPLPEDEAGNFHRKKCDGSGLALLARILQPNLLCALPRDAQRFATDAWVKDSELSEQEDVPQGTGCLATKLPTFPWLTSR
jgi:hypothetical protein